MVDAPEVSVVVPAYNAAATIAPALEGLLAQDLREPHEVIVVDDGSDDGTDAIVKDTGGVRLARQPNQGPAAARNHGARLAKGRVLAFTDSDCTPRPDWLRHGVAALAGADLVQGRVVPDPDAIRGPFDRTIDVRWEYGLYQAANLLVRRELFDELGGFEDWLPARIGKPLAEDVWFGWRARRDGARTAFAAAATVHHAVLPRGPAGYVAERTRLVYFPAMVERMPELRGVFLYRRLFLTRRSAAFDLAVAAIAAALCARRGRRRRLAAGLAILATGPYARHLTGGALRGGRRAPFVMAVDMLADATGLAALAAGSLRDATPVL